MRERSIGGRIGWFFIVIGMAVLDLCMQLGCGLAFMLILAVVAGAKYSGSGMTMREIAGIVAERYQENVLIGVVMYQVLAILAFGLWYFFAYGRKKRPQNAEKPGMTQILIICLIGLLLQILIGNVLSILMAIFPSAFESYNELMETAGLTETTLLSVFSTVIMAPVSEELLCRGLVLRFAGKVSNRYFPANCMQALAFGIMHGNFIQGCYAFLLGLALGYLYQKYRNIWLCMLLHGVFNLSSIVLGFVMEILGGASMMAFGGAALAAAGLLALCFKILGGIRQIEVME